MRYAAIALSLVLSSLTPAWAQLSISFGSPGVSIGINLGGYPTLQRIPGYPVYYAPSLQTNYFFYDGLYWVYENDNWYASSWYNGPWGLVDRFDVPVYLLRVPVRYYRHAPSYFHGWRADAPPRWNEHWGDSWTQRRSGWDRWDRNAVPAPAPLPTYQRQYSGTRYPEPAQQAVLETRNYRYQPVEPVVRQTFQERRAQVPQAQPQPAPRQQAQPRQAPRQVEQAPAPRVQPSPQPQPPQQQPQRQAQPQQQPPQQAERRAQPQQQQPQQQQAERRAQPAPPPAAQRQSPGDAKGKSQEAHEQGKAKGRDKPDKEDKEPGKGKGRGEGG